MVKKIRTFLISSWVITLYPAQVCGPQPTKRKKEPKGGNLAKRKHDTCTLSVQPRGAREQKKARDWDRETKEGEPRGNHGGEKETSPCR